MRMPTRIIYLQILKHREKNDPITKRRYCVLKQRISNSFLRPYSVSRDFEGLKSHIFINIDVWHKLTSIYAIDTVIQPSILCILLNEHYIIELKSKCECGVYSFIRLFFVKFSVFWDIFAKRISLVQSTFYINCIDNNHTMFSVSLNKKGK